VGTKINVAILYGGRSPEHKISLVSAQNVYKSIDKEKYNPILIAIDKSGQWHYHNERMSLVHPDNIDQIALNDTDNKVWLSQNTSEGTLISASTNEILCKIDVIFPVLHGTYGEDGSIQGLSKTAGIACVGCGIIGSSIGMDKDIMKRILRDSDIKVSKGITIRNTSEGIQYDDVVANLGHELFIKPANLGSSVGVSYSDSEEKFFDALNNALKYDNKVIVEQKIVGREIECAVLGNHAPQASIPGEIIPKSSFYSFDNKYIDADGAALHIPAELTKHQIDRIKNLSVETFTVLECRGMARVDMFLTPENELIINEINTIPGFTNISMYPKLWEASGLKQTDLVSKLISLAIEEHNAVNKLLMV
jgi:D-alanine-D-alanine ligase